MNEVEYIKLSNRVRISAALTILSEVVPGADYGIKGVKLISATRQLREIESTLFETDFIDTIE